MPLPSTSPSPGRDAATVPDVELPGAWRWCDDSYGSTAETEKSFVGSMTSSGLLRGKTCVRFWGERTGRGEGGDGPRDADGAQACLERDATELGGVLAVCAAPAADDLDPDGRRQARHARVVGRMGRVLRGRVGRRREGRVEDGEEVGRRGRGGQELGRRARGRGRAEARRVERVEDLDCGRAEGGGQGQPRAPAGLDRERGRGDALIMVRPLPLPFLLVAGLPDAAVLLLPSSPITPDDMGAALVEATGAAVDEAGPAGWWW